MRVSRGVLTVCLVGLAVSRADALDIVVNYRNPGQQLGNFGQATAAPGNTGGAGTLQQLVQSAADYWEGIYSDPFTLSIDYGWFPRDSATATHRLVSQSGGRETHATIAFDSDTSTPWFLDPTPLSASEFTTYREYTANLGGGVMNVGRVYSGGQGNASLQDLFTTALHEIGHALGMSSSNTAYVVETFLDDEIDVGIAPFAGAKIPTDDAHLTLGNELLYPSRPRGVRRLPSDADIWGIAEISNWTITVPEPAMMGWVIGGCLLTRRYRRRGEIRPLRVHSPADV